MQFLPPEIENYAAAHTVSEPALLAELNRYTWAHMLMPRMLSGHIQGRILATFSRMIQPNNILEIGTFTGYSALCLAEGLTENGKLITLEVNEEFETIIQDFFKRSRYSDKIELHIGEARTLIQQFNVDWDLVFIDADKENYIHYLHEVWPKIRKGGWLIADNVLWSGKVTDDLEIKKDPETRALVNFSNEVMNMKDAFPVLFPVRDGLMVVQKTF